jgi:hypothetical protein
VPDYQVKDSGPDHQKMFRAVVKVGARELGAGEGRSKKAAEQLAAEHAYRSITAEAAEKAEDQDQDDVERTVVITDPPTGPVTAALQDSVPPQPGSADAVDA